jgi:hypothetical protein
MYLFYKAQQLQDSRLPCAGWWRNTPRAWDNDAIAIGCCMASRGGDMAELLAAGRFVVLQTGGQELIPGEDISGGGQL